jgi:class 3 adenylate cyclase/predicted ATPase
LDIDGWLRRIGLEQYAQSFRDNAIDADVLRDLTDEHLRELGLPLGARLKILRAVATLGTSEQPPASPEITPTAPRTDAERRQLTIMFCDLVGSTALSTRFDPEDMQEIVGAYHRCCADLIVKAGGFVARYMGDGVLVYFGYPQAHEHDTERAVRAGLALVEAVPKLKTAAGAPLQVRVGIATGIVVVGDLIEAETTQEHEVVGETPNLAARLQALAEPGTLVISSSTHRLTGGLFHYRDLGPVALKGFAETVPVWQVLGASAAESRFEALRASATPLVGRGEEINLLLRRWEQAKGGEGAVVLLSGEPGIGKSRIAETILERLSGEPQTRLRLFCSPHHQDTALYPSITQLERAAGFRRDDTDEQRLTKLEAVLALAANDLGEAVPLLADLLSIPTGDRYPALDLTPQKRREKTLRSLVAQVEGLAARQPVLLVVEDAHWADPTSLELFDLIVERASRLPLLAIVTFRPEFVPPWVGRPQVTLISLNRLPRRLRAEMIAHVTGGKVLPQEIADQITDRTDGVPLFIEELTKAVVESGLLVETGDQYVATGPVTALAIPTSLQASLLARLDRLAPTRDVAQIAAALGRHFSHELISAEQLELDLQIPLGWALIAAKGFSAPEVGESFARARALAEQIDRPEYLGRTFLGQWVFYRNRGEYKLALALAEQVEKIGEARNDVSVQFMGRWASGFTRLHLGDFVAARALLEQCHGLADPALHRHGVRGLHAMLPASLGMTLARLGYIDQARSRLNDALLEARQLRHAQTLAEVLSIESTIDLITGSPEMQRRAEELLALSAEHGLPFYLAWATALRGMSLAALGQGQEGLSLITRGIAGMRATGSVSGTPGALVMLARAYAMVGQPADGLNCLAEAARIIETTEERMGEAALHRVRGDLLNATGDPSAAERSYQQAIAVAKLQSAKLSELQASISVARLWCKQDRRGEARDLLAPIYSWFTEGFDTRYLKEAKALLDELHA